MDFALSSAFTIFPFYIVDHLGGDAAMSGYIGAGQSFIYGVLCVTLSGFLARLVHPLRWAGLGGFGFGTLAALSPVAPTPLAFAGATIAGLSCLALFWPSMQAWLGHIDDPKERSRQIGWYNISWCFGLATGPLCAGPVYDYFGYHVAFAQVFIAAAVAGALAASLPSGGAHKTAEQIAAIKPPSDAAWSEAHLYPTWLASYMGWMMVGVCRTILPVRIHELTEANSLIIPWQELPSYAQAATTYSWLAFVLYASRIVISLIMGRTTSWRHRFSLLIGLQVLAAGAFWVMGVTGNLAVFAMCCTVVGVNGGVSFFASLEYSVANPEHKSRRAAIHESMTGLGSSTGSVIFGFLAGTFYTAWPFQYAPVLIGTFLVAQMVMIRRRTRHLAAGV